MVFNEKEYPVLFEIIDRRDFFSENNIEKGYVFVDEEEVDYVEFDHYHEILEHVASLHFGEEAKKFSIYDSTCEGFILFKYDPKALIQVKPVQVQSFNGLNDDYLAMKWLGYDPDEGHENARYSKYDVYSERELL